MRLKVTPILHPRCSCQHVTKVFRERDALSDIPWTQGATNPITYHVSQLWDLQTPLLLPALQWAEDAPITTGYGVSFLCGSYFSESLWALLIQIWLFSRMSLNRMLGVLKTPCVCSISGLCTCTTFPLNNFPGLPFLFGWFLSGQCT